MRRDVLAEYRRLGIRPVCGGSGEGEQGNQSEQGTSDTDANPGGKQGESGKPEPITFTEAQQAELNRIVKAERQAATEKAKADEKAAREATDEQVRKDRESAEAKAKGDFEKVETTLKADLENAKTEAASLTAQLDQYRAAVAAALESEWKALGPEVTEYYEGAADDPLAQLSWLPKGKKLAEKLNGGSTQRGNGPDPKPKGAAKPANEDAIRAMNARRYG